MATKRNLTTTVRVVNMTQVRKGSYHFNLLKLIQEIISLKPRRSQVKKEKEQLVVGREIDLIFIHAPQETLILENGNTPVSESRSARKAKC